MLINRICLADTRCYRPIHKMPDFLFIYLLLRRRQICKFKEIIYEQVLAIVNICMLAFPYECARRE